MFLFKAFSPQFAGSEVRFTEIVDIFIYCYILKSPCRFLDMALGFTV